MALLLVLAALMQAWLALVSNLPCKFGLLMSMSSNASIFEKLFSLSERNTNVRTEVIAGLTTFLAMVYSVIVVPGMLKAAGFAPESVYVATCLVAGLGSLFIGLYANVPMAIGCAISLTAFTAFSLVLGQKLPIETALAAVFAMGVVFTLISVSGVRSWILRNLPSAIAHGAGIGIGLFLLLIASDNVHLVVKGNALPVALGDITSFPVLATIFGLFATIALEAMRVKGGILLVIVVLTAIGLAFDSTVTVNGFLSVPQVGETSHFFKLDFASLANPAVLPVVFALVMTAVFDATGTIRAVAGQGNLIDDKGQIIGGSKALTADSVSSILAGLVGTAPAAVYIESASGTAAGGKTGLTAVVVGVLFLLMLFFQPLAALVPSYATAPALMYVGLLMLSNVSKLDFADFVAALSGLVTAVFIVLTANIVTGIMLGFVSLVVGRVITRDFKRLNVGTVIIAVALFAFYVTGYAI